MLYMYMDPLEQFSIEIMSSGWLLLNAPFTVPLTSIGRIVLFNFFCVCLWISSLRIIFFTNKLQKLILLTFLFVVNIIIDSMSIKKHSFVLIIYTTFIFLCISNVLGMVPYSLTITSHLIITLYFSLAFFIGSNIIGVRYLKQTFFVLFLPEGVPLVIVPFLILIEYISYISRIFSLAIRLFANMLSGHILLKILISFIWVIITSNVIHWLWNLVPLTIVFTVVGLEFSIALLQAYVFIVLLTIYLKDLIHTH